MGNNWLIGRDDVYLYALSLIMVGKGRRWLLLILDEVENLSLVLEWNGGSGSLAGGWMLLDQDL